VRWNSILGIVVETVAVHVMNDTVVSRGSKPVDWLTTKET